MATAVQLLSLLVPKTIPAVQTTIPTAIATSFTPCTDILPHLGGYEAIKRITPETVLFYSLSL